MQQLQDYKLEKRKAENYQWRLLHDSTKEKTNETRQNRWHGFMATPVNIDFVNIPKFDCHGDPTGGRNGNNFLTSLLLEERG